jgi:hypothetical protein
MTTPPPPPETPPPPPPSPSGGAGFGTPVGPTGRISAAIAQRPQTDYLFEGPGLNIFLTIITCGIFGWYLFYQLMRRDRDHLRRRYELLDAANTYAWDQASQRGFADELRPAFERIAANLGILQVQTREFRDPGIWLLIAILTGIAQIVGYVFIDQDLDTQERAEGAIEAELVEIYARLGVTLPAPDPSRIKGKHNYAARIIVSIVTCGVYTYWWLYNLMVEGNQHVEQSWPFEDALAAGVA